MSRWLARWRAALRIARRDAWRNKGRTALVVLLMMLPVAAGTFVVGVVRMSQATPETEMAWALGDTAQARLSVACGERMEIEQNAAGSSASCGPGSPLGPLTDAELASALPAGTTVTAGQQAATSLRTEDRLVDHAQVIAVDAAAVPGLLGQVTGEAVPSAGQAVLSPVAANKLDVGVGGELELRWGEDYLPVEVVGIGDSSTRTAAVLGPGTLPAMTEGTSTVPVWFVTSTDPVTWQDVQALNQVGLIVKSRAVILDPPPAAEVYGGAFSTPGPDARMLGYILAVGGLGLLEVVLLVGPAFAVGARRSARSLALVAAAGGQPRDLRRIVLAGGVVAGLVAAIVGAALGGAASVLLYLLLQGSETAFPNLVFPFGSWAPIALVAVFLGIAAAWFPARTASRADVVDSLAGRRGHVPHRRIVSWVGVGVAALGLALGVLAAVSGQPILLAVGAVGVEIGIVMSAGGLLSLVGTLAPRLGVAGRFALRDAVRHRSRTTPAVAAVVAAVAAMTAGAIFVVSEDNAWRGMWQPVAADGTGLLSLEDFSLSADEIQDQLDQSLEIVTEELPEAQVAEVRELTEVRGSGFSLPFALPDPATVCPDPEAYSADADDPRCRAVTSASAGFSWAFRLVDDGTFVRTLGLDGAAEAGAALARGAALINDPDLVWPDGNVHLGTVDDDGRSEEQLVLPAHLVTWVSNQYHLVLPLGAVDQIPAAGGDGSALDRGLIETRAVGATITGATLEPADVDRLNRLLSDVGPNVHLSVEGRMNQRDSATTTLILLGIAAFVALAATGLSVGLALADSRADLATLAAVGASPRIRRRVTAAQAGVVAVIGTVTGVGTGIALGYVLGWWSAANFGFAPVWRTIVPWPILALALVGIPALAMGATWLLTRSRLPVGRRVAS